VNLGAPELLILSPTLIALALGIWVAVDASRLPTHAFERAGTSKTLWIVLPLVGFVACGVVTIVAAILWFATYRPRVAGHASGEAASQAAGD
jgi:hypothetical protein